MATNAAIEADTVTGPDEECTAVTIPLTDMAAGSIRGHTKDEVAAVAKIKARRERQKKFKAFSSILALFSVASLIAWFGLGVAAVVAASQCYGNTLTQLVSNCKRGHEERRILSYYWLTGSTIAAICFLPFATGLCYYIVELLIMYGKDDAEAKEEERKQKEEAKKKKIEAAANGGQLQESTDGAYFEISPADVEQDDLVIYDIGDVQRGDFKSLTLTAQMLLFFALAFFMLALVGVLWMICIGYNFFNQATSEVWPFIVTEVVVGIVCPIFIFFGCVLLAPVVTFVTAEQVDLRIIIQRMVPSVKLEIKKPPVKLEIKKPPKKAKGSCTKAKDPANEYWVIADHYSIPLKKRSGKKYQLRHAVSKDASTWLLASIAGLAAILTLSIFVNNTMVQGLVVPISEFLEESDICLDYACFSPGTLDYISVNCSDVNSANFSNIKFLHCFRFFEFGKSADFITNVAIAVAFYWAVVHFFQLVFTVTNILMHIKESYAWGILMVLVGILTIAGGAVYCASPYFAVVQLDAITVGQIFLVAIYIVLIGALLLTRRIHTLQPGSHSKKASEQKEPGSPDLGEVEAQ